MVSSMHAIGRQALAVPLDSRYTAADDAVCVAVRRRLAAPQGFVGTDERRRAIATVRSVRSAPAGRDSHHVG